MAVLGNSTQGPSVRALSNQGRGSVFTATENGSITSLHAWLADQDTGAVYRMALYSVSGDTATKLAQSDSKTGLTSTFTDEAFTSAAISALSLVNGTSYLPLAAGNSANAQVAHDTGAGTTASVGDINDLPASFSISANADSRLYSTWIVYTPSGGGAFTLTCDQGSYALNGQDASLVRNSTYSIACDSGTYNLIGSNALIDLSMVCEFGSYALNGQDAGLLFGHFMTCVFGIYNLSGQNVILLRNGIPAATGGMGSSDISGTNLSTTSEIGGSELSVIDLTLQ